MLRIIVEQDRAVGVELSEGGRVRVERAGREVVLTAGAINTPRLMLLSGIGPADHLRKVGLPVVHHLPGVGGNLQDHMDVYMVYELTGAHGYDRYKKMAVEGLGWAAIRALPAGPGLFQRD